MLEYRCDWCHRLKKPDDVWIVGLAGERSGVTGSRRQMETLKKWNTQWAVHPLAVHFCSTKHKDKFVEALFSSEWPTVSKSAISKAAARRRKAKENKPEKISDAVVERHIEDSPSISHRHGPAKEEPRKARRGRKSKKTPPNIFADTDAFYARSFGIVLDAPEEPKDDAPEK